MKVDVRISVKDEVKDEVESSDRSTMEVRVDLVVGVEQDEVESSDRGTISRIESYRVLCLVR
ncbi:hypothetical protein Tco_0623646, partial [Tanacetum coccineum]